MGEQDDQKAVDKPPGGIPVFLELFSVSARLCQAVKSELVGWGGSWDVEDGPELDLLNEGNVQRILTAIRMGVHRMVHMGPPCSTFSRARWPRLRTRDYIFGVKGFSQAQKLQLRVGSALCMAAIQMAKACVRWGVGFTSITQPRP